MIFLFSTAHCRLRLNFNMSIISQRQSAITKTGFFRVVSRHAANTADTAMISPRLFSPDCKPQFDGMEWSAPRFPFFCFGQSQKAPNATPSMRISSAPILSRLSTTVENQLLTPIRYHFVLHAQVSNVGRPREMVPTTNPLNFHLVPVVWNVVLPFQSSEAEHYESWLDCSDGAPLRVIPWISEAL